MIEYFNNHIYSFWFAVGFLLLAVEMLALGFSTGFVLFIGLAGLLTGGLVWFGLVAATWSASIAAFAVSSVVVSAILWKPLKSLQNKQTVPEKDNTSDLIGLTFRLEMDITATIPGRTHYSGIDWKVELDPGTDVKEVTAGTMVRVVSVDAGKFWVIPHAAQ